MPFTFSHPALILPLNKLKQSWLSLTGLVVGSITPDFEYFIRMDAKRVYTHTWPGLVVYDLPLGILLAFIFHNIVRNPFINHAPKSLQQRLIPYKNFDWNARFRKHWFGSLVSFLIGGASHLLWDSFTHAGRFFVRSIPPLSDRVEVVGRYMHVYTMLQILSSLLGIMVIAYALWQLPVEQRATTNKKVSDYWLLVAVMAAMILTIRILVGENISIPDLILSAISAFLIALILTPLFLRMVQRWVNT